MEDSKFIRPVRKDYVILFDDPETTEEHGVQVVHGPWKKNLDYVVARGSGDGFAPGSLVVLDDPNTGRKLKLNGVGYRIVPRTSIIAVVVP
jgi:hypothetical protein